MGVNKVKMVFVSHIVVAYCGSPVVIFEFFVNKAKFAILASKSTA